MPENIASTRDVLLQTETIEAAAEFYEKEFGLAVFHRSETIIGLETGAFRLFLDRGEAYGPVFEFIVPDLESTKSRLITAGCRIENEAPSVPRCYLRDPFGLVFNISQRP
jgi:predicted enzyme related to lactoylglutathione lyase